LNIYYPLLVAGDGIGQKIKAQKKVAKKCNSGINTKYFDCGACYDGKNHEMLPAMVCSLSKILLRFNLVL